MISYGIKGLDVAEVRPHRYCPAIHENCCSNQDAFTSKNLWNNQFKFLIERYYETYLYSIKYLLGFSNEAFLLAR